MYFCSPAQVMKLVDMRDLKSLAYCWRTGSIPVLGTLKGFRKGAFFLVPAKCLFAQSDKGLSDGESD